MSRLTVLMIVLGTITVFCEIRPLFAQRIQSISTLDVILSSTGNDELSNTEDQPVLTTVFDVLLRPNLRNGNNFDVNIQTLSSTGAQGADVCDKPTTDGLCEISTPATLSFTTGNLVHRYQLKARAAIPYLYYHRRYISCSSFDRTTSSDDLDEDDGDVMNFCYREIPEPALKAECVCRTPEKLSGDKKGYNLPLVFDDDEDIWDFRGFDISQIDVSILKGKERNAIIDSFNNDFFRNSSLFFGVDVVSNDGSVRYEPPEPAGDADGDLFYIFSQQYVSSDDEDDDDDLWYSHYISRRMEPLCTVYDIDPIPEEVMHVSINLEIQGQAANAETLTLSTINESNNGFSTSGSSRNNAGGRGAFTARLQNTRSATSSYGPTAAGSIIMCPDIDPKDKNGGITSSFINTLDPIQSLDLTENPWATVFPPDDSDGNTRKTSAAGKLFDRESIAALQSRPIDKVGPRSGIYYYDSLTSSTVGSGCGEMGVTNRIYANVPAQISNVVKKTTLKEVSMDLMRGNFSKPGILPTCIPGFGPSSAQNTPTPGIMLAEQKRFMDEFDASPDTVRNVPHLPPFYNIIDPNIYFYNGYMYVTSNQADIETEAIVTISGSFLRVTGTQPSGVMDRDATYCAMLSESTSESTVGVVGTTVCNTAERLQVDNPDMIDIDNDAVFPNITVQVDPALVTQYTLQLSCDPSSGVAVKTSTTSETSTLKFTGFLEPGRCEVVQFDITPTVDSLPEDSRCELSLLNTQGILAPGQVIIDRVNVPCTLNIDYTPPVENVNDRNGSVIQGIVVPEIFENDDNHDNVFRLLMGLLFIVFPAFGALVIFGFCIANQINLQRLRNVA